MLKIPDNDGNAFGVAGAEAGLERMVTKPGAVGWEKNVQGKLGPRVADLAPMMDPTRCVPSLCCVPFVHPSIS